jgi:hypothetical protein
MVEIDGNAPSFTECHSVVILLDHIPRASVQIE